MARPSVNFVVDASAFVGFAFLTTTGILMHYQLPPGSGGSRAIWGMNRHDWGQIHFWLAVAMLAALAAHLLLHMKWIVFMVRGRRSEHPRAFGRVAVGVLALTALAALAVSPLISPVQAIQGGSGHDEAEHHAASAAPRPAEPGPGSDPELELAPSPVIRGSSSLTEIARAAGIEAAALASELKLPASFPADERMGPNQETFGYTMEDVRAAVARLRAAQGR